MLLCTSFYLLSWDTDPCIAISTIVFSNKGWSYTIFGLPGLSLILRWVCSSELSSNKALIFLFFSSLAFCALSWLPFFIFNLNIQDPKTSICYRRYVRKPDGHIYKFWFTYILILKLNLYHQYQFRLVQTNFQKYSFIIGTINMKCLSSQILTFKNLYLKLTKSTQIK